MRHALHESDLGQRRIDVAELLDLAEAIDSIQAKPLRGSEIRKM
jgi:hypothetical protein